MRNFIPIDGAKYKGHVTIGKNKYPILIGPWGKLYAQVGPSPEGIDMVEVIALEQDGTPKEGFLHLKKDYFL